MTHYGVIRHRMAGTVSKRTAHRTARGRTGRLFSQKLRRADQGALLDPGRHRITADARPDRQRDHRSAGLVQKTVGVRPVKRVGHRVDRFHQVHRRLRDLPVVAPFNFIAPAIRAVRRRRRGGKNQLLKPAPTSLALVFIDSPGQARGTYCYRPAV